MVLAAGLAGARANGAAVASVRSRQEDDGQPILLSAMWLVPGALVGAAVVMVLFMSRKK
jgi:hypothetical protein